HLVGGLGHGAAVDVDPSGGDFAGCAGEGAQQVPVDECPVESAHKEPTCSSRSSSRAPRCSWRSAGSASSASARRDRQFSTGTSPLTEAGVGAGVSVTCPPR